MKDDKYDFKAFTDLLKTRHNLDDHPDRWDAIVSNLHEFCDFVSDEDRCELALKVIVCQKKAFRDIFGSPDDADMSEMDEKSE